jgi:CHAT domain
VPQSGPEDGLLTGLEVASLRLSGTRLVVLSTCEAGQGVPVDGQGVLGLRAAFSIAGAEGLVMSLWPVDDKAGRLFMQYFYAHLDAGPAEAIRLAQLEMMAKSEYKQPRYWAGYAYSGSPSVNAWRQSTAAPNPAGESLVTPTCLEVNTRMESGNYTHNYTFRVKIAGAVSEASRTAERVVYNLLPPGSDLEESSTSAYNHGSPIPFPEVHVASHSKFSLTLTIEKTKDYSSLTIREFVPEGDTRYKPQTVREIVLKGGPAVFPNLAIPSTFPALESYTETSIFHGGNGTGSDTVERVGACRQ